MIYHKKSTTVCQSSDTPHDCCVTYLSMVVAAACGSAGRVVVAVVDVGDRTLVVGETRRQILMIHQLCATHLASRPEKNTDGNPVSVSEKLALVSE